MNYLPCPVSPDGTVLNSTCRSCPLQLLSARLVCGRTLVGAARLGEFCAVGVLAVLSGQALLGVPWTDPVVAVALGVVSAVPACWELAVGIPALEWRRMATGSAVAATLLLLLAVLARVPAVAVLCVALATVVSIPYMAPSAVRSLSLRAGKNLDVRSFAGWWVSSVVLVACAGVELTLAGDSTAFVDWRTLLAGVVLWLFMVAATYPERLRHWILDAIPRGEDLLRLLEEGRPANDEGLSQVLHSERWAWLLLCCIAPAAIVGVPLVLELNVVAGLLIAMATCAVVGSTFDRLATFAYPRVPSLTGAFRRLAVILVLAAPVVGGISLPWHVAPRAVLVEILSSLSQGLLGWGLFIAAFTGLSVYLGRVRIWPIHRTRLRTSLWSCAAVTILACLVAEFAPASYLAVHAEHLVTCVALGCIGVIATGVAAAVLSNWRSMQPR